MDTRVLTFACACVTPRETHDGVATPWSAFLCPRPFARLLRRTVASKVRDATVLSQVAPVLPSECESFLRSGHQPCPTCDARTLFAGGVPTRWPVSSDAQT